METETNDNLIYRIGEAITTEIDEIINIKYTYVKDEKSIVKLIMKDGSEYSLLLEKQ